MSNFKRKVDFFFSNLCGIYGKSLNWLFKNGHFEKHFFNKLSEVHQLIIYILADPCGISKHNTWSLAANTYFSYVNPAIRERVLSWLAKC
jgi:hypothetical protein